MLKVAIESGYTTNFKGNDEFGAQYFMQEIFKKHGIELVRVSINKYNKLKKTFTEYSIYENIQKPKTIKKQYTPDILWNRSSKGTTYKYHSLEGLNIIPSEKIRTIANDKYEMYMFLKEHQPKTFLLSSVFKNTEIQKENNGLIIIKPIRANGGKGIIKTTIQELIKKRKKYIGLEELYIAQEFKDFSKGYPGLVEGNHDVRIMFAGKEIIETTLRIPKKGGFKSNIGSGGKQFAINKDILPKEIIKLAKNIYKKLSKEQKEIFSIDFAFCKPENRRYVLEINASPGTRYYQTNKKILEKICKGLIVFFISISK